MASQYSLYSSTFTPATGDPLVLNQVSGRSVSNGLRLHEQQLAGAVDRAGTVILAGDPVVGLQTMDLLTALTAISLTTGYRAASGAILRYQKRGSDVVSGSGTTGPFTTGSTHRTVTSPKGMLMPTSLSVAQDGLAMLALTYHGYESDDGATRPFTLNTSQALAGTPALNSLYTLGPVKLGASALDGLIGWEFDTGLGAFETRRKNGRTYPNEGKLRSRLARLVLKFDNPEIADSVGSYFHAQLGSTLTAYARKKSLTSTDGNVADDQSSHLSIAIAAGSWKLDDESANDHDDIPGQVSVFVNGTITSSLTAAIA